MNYILLPDYKQAVLYNLRSVSIRITDDEQGRKAKDKLDKAYKNGTKVVFNNHDYFVDEEL